MREAVDRLESTNKVRGAMNPSPNERIMSNIRRVVGDELLQS